MKIFLVGLMGSGKSYWTKQLAKKHKTGGYDLDDLIEVKEEKTIAEIFTEDGEDYFRKVESTVLKWFAEKKNIRARYRRWCGVAAREPGAVACSWRSGLPQIAT